LSVGILLHDNFINRSFYGDLNMASKATKSAKTQTSTSFTSLKDAGFQQAGTHSTMADIARYVMSQDATFPAEVSQTVRDALYEGYRLKFSHLNPAKPYAVINDHYVEATQEHLTNDKVEKILVGVEYAFSYSQQEFGKLKNTKPALHALIGGVRDKTVSYCSNRLGDLKRTAKTVLGEDKPKDRKRSANKDFAEFVDEWFKTSAPDRLKSANARGDASADIKRFNDAKVAFMTKWRHADAK
jgi:hypothetical protein